MLITNGEDRVFDGRGCAIGRMQGSSGQISQCLGPSQAYAVDPFVAGFGADAKASAEGSDVGSFDSGQGNELGASGHGTHILPRHRLIPLSRSTYPWIKCYPCPRTPVTHLSGLHTMWGRGRRRPSKMVVAAGE